MRPLKGEPIGLQLVRTTRLVSRAFDEALAAAGGSLPVWLILVSLKSGRHGTQRELAEAVGVEGPTLTHHLRRLERDGLVTRSRDPENLRVQRVELTDTGNALFFELLGVVQAFDRRLRDGVPHAEVAVLEDLLGRLRHNVRAREAHQR
jgi:MarR family transcriptional regulator for hemolysin